MGETRKRNDDSQYTLRAATADAVGWAVTVQQGVHKGRRDDPHRVRGADSPSVDEETAERETTLGMTGGRKTSITQQARMIGCQYNSRDLSPGPIVCSLPVSLFILTHLRLPSSSPPWQRKMPQRDFEEQSKASILVLIVTTPHPSTENNLFLVKRLIQRTDMRNPDPGTKRYTSLAWAAALGHEETFEFLLTAGHDDEELSRVRILCIAHASTPGLHPNDQDAESNTILMLLADFKPPPPNPYAPGPSQVDQMGAALRMARLYYDRYTWILDWSNAQGKTALHIAALKGNEELVRVRGF